MIGPNGMVGYDIVLGRVTYSYGIEFTPIKISSFALRSSTPSATMRVMCSLTVTSTSVTMCLGVPAGIYNSPGTYNWDVAGYINKYGETYSSTSVNNSDYDSCGRINHQEKSAFRSPGRASDDYTYAVGPDGDIGLDTWGVMYSCGKNHSYQI